MLSSGLSRFHFLDSVPKHPAAHTQTRFNPRHQPSPGAINALDNDGKVLKGVDRQGDQWCITLTGPGTLIITDTTPNDGTFNDDLDVIQIVGSDPNKTRVAGQTSASPRIRTEGVVIFNRLTALNGVKSIDLDGFSLGRTRTPGDILNTDPEIFLPGGVERLSFHDILGNIDTSNLDGSGTDPLAKPFQIVIGDPTTPLNVSPTIKLDRIFTTVFDSVFNATRVVTTKRNDPEGDSIQSLTIQAPPTQPVTTPTVEFVVNGTLRGLDIVSATGSVSPRVGEEVIFPPLNTFTPPLDTTIIPGSGEEVQFPTVGTTGRTAVRANAVGTIKSVANVKNLAVSRSRTPFENGFTGVDRIGKVRIGGNADGLGLDVNGPIGSISARKGLGSPTDNRRNSPISTERNASNLGIPDAERGYPTASDLLDPASDGFTTDPNSGGYGALIKATSIKSVKAGSANTRNLLGQNPLEYQKRRSGYLSYTLKPGNALTSVAIAAADSIGQVSIIGDSSNSEIQAGFDYNSFVNGLDAERSPSSIGNVDIRGDLVDSVIGSTYGPGADRKFGTADDKIGPGSIKGKLKGRALTTADIGSTSVSTILGRQGAGAFAARRSGSPDLEPPPKPARANNILIR